MSKELTEDDLKQFDEFEKTILDLKDSNVKYRRDNEMEAEIKKEVLFSHFGQEKVNIVMEKLNIDFLDLTDQKIYVEIYRFLDS